MSAHSTRALERTKSLKLGQTNCGIMKFLLRTLLVCAPCFSALRAPKGDSGFRRFGEVPATNFSSAAVGEAIKTAPLFFEDAIALSRSMNGSHQIIDALREATAAPKSLTSFAELEGKIESAMERSYAWKEMNHLIEFGAKRLSHFAKLGINSINIGIARSAAPWYQWIEKLTAEESNFDFLDNNDVHLIGGVSFFLNIAFKNSKAQKIVKNQWRMCFAAGLSSSVFFRGKFFNSGFEGSDFGGEDLYFAFANSDNVPGWSWALNFNHDYVARYLGVSAEELVQKIETNNKYAEANHAFSHLSRLSGGFEFTSTGPLDDLVAINFGYCIMGRSQGGACIDRLKDDNMSQKHQAIGADIKEKAGTDEALSKKTLDKIIDSEKWSKNTVEVGVGHCWCTDFTKEAGWGDFSE